MVADSAKQLLLSVKENQTQFDRQTFEGIHFEEIAGLHVYHR